MMRGITINTVEVTVECHCGETVDVTLSSRDATILDGYVRMAAEEEAQYGHGWGSGGFCPACEKAHQKDIQSMTLPSCNEC